MTNAIIINDKNRSIEISKKFANEARKFGTSEYMELMEARKAFPRYKVVTKSTGKSRDNFKGLTYDYMENYINTKIAAADRQNKESGNDGAENEHREILIQLYTLCGKDENGKPAEFAAIATYGEVKKWFLEQYPEIDTKRKTIDEILGKSKKAA